MGKHLTDEHLLPELLRQQNLFGVIKDISSHIGYALIWCDYSYLFQFCTRDLFKINITTPTLIEKKCIPIIALQSLCIRWH